MNPFNLTPVCQFSLINVSFVICSFVKAPAASRSSRHSFDALRVCHTLRVSTYEYASLTDISGYLRLGHHLQPLVVFNVMNSLLSSYCIHLCISPSCSSSMLAHMYINIIIGIHSRILLLLFLLLLISIFLIPSPPSLYSLHDTLPCCHGNNQDLRARLLSNSHHP